ncbi:two-component sensor histidine kinase, partial [Streptomyces bambusae]|nr:two-component sensor histidine kinase [Streptomyces bambusae]
MLLASLGVYAAVGHLVPLPYARLQLAVLAAGTALFPLRRRLPRAVLLTLAVLTGPAPWLGPVTAATAYTVAHRTARSRDRTRLLTAAGTLLVASAA